MTRIRIVGPAAALLALALLAGCGRGDESPSAVAANATLDGAKEDEEDDPAQASPVLARGPDSAEGRLVSALADARNLRVLRLEPAGADVDCRMGNCIEGNAVVAGVILRDFASNAQARTVVREWLVDGVLAEPACAPEYRHAVAFASGGRDVAVLFDYACNNYRIVIDGTLGDGAVRSPSGRQALDALLASPTAPVEGDAGEDEAIEGGDPDAPTGA
jgi:hypothetical protein